MNIEFKIFSEFQRGIIYELLKDGYSFESRYASESSPLSTLSLRKA